jgi:hypothetical protein
MGTVYAIACPEYKEKIDPNCINARSAKLYKIGEPGHPVGVIALFAIWNRWNFSPITLVADTALEDPITGLQPYDDYLDVTEHVIDDYNGIYDTEIAYTP